MAPAEGAQLPGWRVVPVVGRPPRHRCQDGVRLAALVQHPHDRLHERRVGPRELREALLRGPEGGGVVVPGGRPAVLCCVREAVVGRGGGLPERQLVSAGQTLDALLDVAEAKVAHALKREHGCHQLPLPVLVGLRAGWEAPVPRPSREARPALQRIRLHSTSGAVETTGPLVRSDATSPAWRGLVHSEGISLVEPPQERVHEGGTSCGICKTWRTEPLALMHL
mmetsp:Transcript_5879/g.14293  ORF Transcript_5879/g.14293 Transcript_5879/m.14293 type:complete len:224 (-) Transcript_5879:297-968(-)